MTPIDTLGWFASSLVLATFCAKNMVSLRLLAIASNAAFIAYSSSAHLWPILLLHAVMLPLNVRRLYQANSSGDAPLINRNGQVPQTIVD